MNNKRRRGRTNKIDHGNHLMEGKSQITSRRLTIRPGFLCRGIASETIKKPKNDTAIRKRERILKEDLHSFFDQATLRRSQRILKKFEDDSPSTVNSDPFMASSTSLGIQPQVLATVQNPNSKAAVRNNSKSIFKEINEKYITAELQNFNLNRNQSQRAAENQDFKLNFSPEENNFNPNQNLIQSFSYNIEQQNPSNNRYQELQTQRSAENQGFALNLDAEKNNFNRNQNLNQSFAKCTNPKIQNLQVLDVPPSLYKFNGFARQPFLKNIFETNHNFRPEEELFKKPPPVNYPETCHNFYPEKEVFKHPLQANYLKPSINKFFCAELQKQISVKLKKNERVEVFRRIEEEVDKTNLVLQGKLEYMDMYSSEKYQPEKSGRDDDILESFTPVPPQRWVFRTPPRQRLEAPQMAEESCLQRGVLYSNSKNMQYNLYEVKPNLNIDVNQFRKTENVPIDNRYLNCVAQVNRTPFDNNYGFGRDAQGCSKYQTHENHPQLVQNTEPNFHNGVNGYIEYGGVNPGYPHEYNNGEIRIQQTPDNSGFYTVISKPCKTMRQKIDAANFEFRTPPHPIQNADDFDKDFTFIEENGTFTLQESEINNPKKRKVNDDFVVIPNNSLSNTSGNRNMFNFSQVDENKNNNNLFQFGQLNI